MCAKLCMHHILMGLPVRRMCQKCLVALHCNRSPNGQRPLDAMHADDCSS